MAMTLGPGRGGMKGGINVTPLVEGVIVLLILFMGLAPMMQRGQDEEPPKASHPGGDERDEPPVHAITVDQRLYVEQGYYSDAAGFRTRLEREVRSQPLPHPPMPRSSSLAKERVP